MQSPHPSQRRLQTWDLCEIGSQQTFINPLQRGEASVLIERTLPWPRSWVLGVAAQVVPALTAELSEALVGTIADTFDEVLARGPF